MDICLAVGRQHTRASQQAFIKQSLYLHTSRPKILRNYNVKLLPTCEINEIIDKKFFKRHTYMPLPDYSEQIIQKIKYAKAYLTPFIAILVL